MKNLLLGIFCIFATTIWGQTAVSPTAGDGTIGNPYQISTIGNLYWISENSSRWANHYIQTENIDASETSSWFADGGGSYYGWAPIGNFTGSYNGNGYSINGLYINRTGEDYQGLFGTTSAATISNLGLRNAVIRARHYTGGLIGYSTNNTSVVNCYVMGDINGSWHVGGLIGDNYSSNVDKCFSTGSVAGSPMIGGLVGSSQYSATVTNSYSRSAVSGGLYEIGGLVGGMFYSASVSNCFSTGTVTGPNFYLGGLIGRNYSSPVASNSFWDTGTSGLTSSAGGTGKTTVEMKTQATFTNAGWDFTNVWGINADENDGYPNLMWQNFSPQAYAPSKGNGTIGDPYQIANLGNLYWIASDATRWNKNYIQTADINALETTTWSGGGWTPIGNEGSKFSGTYNGNGHTINGLYINRGGTDHQGLFGYTNGATIKNLGVTNVNITTYRKIGALAGNIENTTIINCYSSGNVSGSFIIGSLIGITYYSTVSNCYSTGSVSGETTIGGLVGYNYTGSTISNCYSTAYLPGSHSTIGGLVGYNWNASVTNSFWDIETSGQISSSAGTGKTTLEMKSASTFLNASWNPQVWKLGDGMNDGYPYLAWQNPDGTSLFQTPILASPNNNSNGISISDTLRWFIVSGTDKYRLEINEQSDFLGTMIFNADTLRDTIFILTGLAYNETYYWRVTALNNFGFSSDMSAAFSFKTKLMNVILNLPENNTTRMDLTPTLKWTSIEAADKYKLEVNTAPDFSGTIIFIADSLIDTIKTLDSLTNNFTYYWRVTALDNSGNFSDPSNIFKFTTKLMSASLINPENNSFNLSLTPTLEWGTVDGANKYRLEVNSQTDFLGDIIFDEDTINLTSKQIGRLTDNTDYYWRITALNSEGNSGDTSITYKFSTDYMVLSSIPNGAMGVTTSPTLNWEKTSGASKYRLEVNTASDFAGLSVLDSTSIADTSYTLTELINNTTYYWRVTASSDALLKPNTSPVYNFTTKLAKPLLNQPLNNSSGNSLIPYLIWTEVPGADRYKLEVNTNVDFTGSVIYESDTINTNSQIISGLKDNNKYYWRVTAFNESGNISDTSEIFVFTTSQTILSATSNGAVAVGLNPTLVWLKTDGANKYKLEVNTTEDFTGEIIFDNDGLTDTMQIISGLKYNTTYFWRVFAVSEALLKTKISDIYRFTTKLITPSLYSPANNSTDVSLSPTLNWSVVSGAEQYKLEIDTKPDFNGAAVYLTNTFIEMNGLANNNTYYWRVTALNNLGNSSDTSTTFKFTTLNISGIDTLKVNLPTKYQVFQNYPNPFNPTTKISYAIPQNSFVELKVFNLLGQEIATLVNQERPAGNYEVNLDASNLPSGVYLYRLQAVDPSTNSGQAFVQTRKMILLK